jgi:SAM-dependent methyltransferase
LRIAQFKVLTAWIEDRRLSAPAPFIRDLMLTEERISVREFTGTDYHVVLLPPNPNRSAANRGRLMESPYFDHEKINKAVKSGRHREIIGGLWDEIGILQYQFLIDHGLQPRHTCLDIGCGSLRGGMHLIRYLEAGNYIGVDINQSLLDAGYEIELKKAGLQHKILRKNLFCTAAFEFDCLERRFDFALAQSLFTHLTFNQIRRCLDRLAPVMSIGGHFFATFFEIGQEQMLNLPYTHEPGGVITYDVRDP